MQVDIHRRTENGDIVRLVKPLKVRFQQHSFVIHSGFECDGVSVPRFAWSLVSPCIDPRSLRAGVAHDYIYRVQPEGWSRGTADLLFLCFLIEDGLPVFRALLAYAAVRLFGWTAWNRSTRELEESASGQ